MGVALRVTLILYIMYNVAYTLGRFYSTVAYVLEIFFPKVAYVLEKVRNFAAYFQGYYVRKKTDNTIATVER